MSIELVTTPWYLQSDVYSLDDIYLIASTTQDTEALKYYDKEIRKMNKVYKEMLSRGDEL